jgi:RecA/RadA recombinase
MINQLLLSSLDHTLFQRITNRYHQPSRYLYSYCIDTRNKDGYHCYSIPSSECVVPTMSASHRKISRLPLPVFQDLITRPPLNNNKDNDIDEHDPERLKSIICNRLKRFVVRNNGRKNKNNRIGGGGGISGISPSSTCSIKTIGQLLRLSKCTLLFALDPILTYEEVSIFLDRVCNQCSPKPNSVLQLLKDTTNAANANANANADLNVNVNVNVNVSSCSEHNNASQQQDRQQQQQQQRPSTTTTTTTTTDHITFGNSMRDLPTCLPSFDRILRGGVRMGTVTELVGKSGTGKTQLALQLCIAAAKFNQGAIYIDSEKKLSLPRLREMSERWRAHGLQERRQRRLEQSQNNTVGGVGGGVGTDHHHPGRQFPNKAAATRFSYNQGSYGNSSYPTPNSQSQQSFYSNNNYDDDESNDEDAMGTFKSTELVLGNLTLHQPGSSSELLDVLDALEDEILQRNQTAGQAFPASSTASTIENITTGNNVRRGKYPVRLLIVDSIASPMRRDFGTDSAPQRASAIFQCAQKLKRLADQLHLAVVVINQVGSDNRAALGTSWHHCVSTRLMLETATTTSDANKVGLDHSNGTNEFGTNNVDLNNNLNSRQSMQPDHRITRKIAVVKSNKTGFGETGFEITTMGIVEDSIAGL